MTARTLALQVEYVAAGPAYSGVVTHYGEQYNGSTLGCGGTYSSLNPSIIAVAPSQYAEWPCGTYLMVCGTAACNVGIRQDSCPGCAPFVLDLSEAGIDIVCGPDAGVCDVTVQRLLTMVLEQPPG